MRAASTQNVVYFCVPYRTSTRKIKIYKNIKKTSPDSNSRLPIPDTYPMYPSIEFKLSSYIEYYSLFYTRLV